MGSEGDISGCGHHDVGDDPAVETAHAVGQRDAGYPAEQLEALGQQRERRGLVLTFGEAHEAPAAPGEDGTEDLVSVLLAPVEDEVLTGHRLPGPVDTPRAAVFGLRGGHGTTERSRRAGIAGGPAERQQALRADAAIAGLHPRGDERQVWVGDLRSGWPLERWPRAAFDDPAHGLVGRAGQCRGGTIAAQLLIL